MIISNTASEAIAGVAFLMKIAHGSFWYALNC